MSPRTLRFRCQFGCEHDSRLVASLHDRFCSGSRQPAIDGMPDNCDRWGTCPVCGDTFTSSAVVMADHEASR